jgi:hypothetical protein
MYECKYCDKEVQYINRSDIPLLLLKEIESIENQILSNGTYPEHYIYCKNCDTYSVLSADCSVQVSASTHAVINLYTKIDSLKGDISKIIEAIEDFHPAVKEIKQKGEGHNEVILFYPQSHVMLSNPLSMGRFAALLHYFMLHGKKITFAPSKDFQIQIS